MFKPVLIFLSLFCLSCNNPIAVNKSAVETESLVEEPENVKVHILPPNLVEISGISFLDNDSFLAVQDEEGILYEYNLKEKKNVKEFKFGEPNDYEDLVRVGKDVYIVISNGTVIQIKNFQSANPVIREFKTPLKKKNDIEGLAYEPEKNRLLLAAKEKGMDEDENTKEIYAFDLKTMTLQSKPAYSIRLDEIEAYFEGDAIVESSKKFLKAIGNQNMNKVFKSSALTVHPKTNYIYVLSSINNLIAVLDTSGKLDKIIQFEGKEYTQPEGIAFTEDGKLYVSNEGGKNGRGNIIELEYEN